MNNTAEMWLKISLIAVFIFSVGFSSTFGQGIIENEKLDNLLAGKKVNQILSFIDSAGLRDPGMRAKTLRVTAGKLLDDNELQGARTLAAKAAEINKIIIQEMELARCYYLLSRIAALQGDFLTSRSLSWTGTNLARQYEDYELEYNLNNILSWSYFSLKEDLNVILNHERRQFDLVNALDDPLKKAHVYNNLGYDLTIAGTVPLDSTRSLMIYANKVYANEEEHQGRWYTLMNLTWISRLQNDLVESRKFGEMSYKKAIGDNDRHAIIESGFHYAETLLMRKEVEKATRIFESIMVIADEANDRDKYVFDIYYSYFMWKLGNRPEHITPRLRDAITYLSEGEVFYEMHGRALMARLYLEQGMLNDADLELSWIENPRQNYISAETRCLSAIVRAELMAKDGDIYMATELLKGWERVTNRMQAYLLHQYVIEAQNRI